MERRMVSNGFQPTEVARAHQALRTTTDSRFTQRARYAAASGNANGCTSCILVRLPNNAMKLTKPIQVRAPRHSASLHGAPCRSARSSLMRASQLIAVFCGPTAMEAERA